MKGLTPIHKFTKTGFWLAVVTKNRRLFVVSASKYPKKALDTAHLAGYQAASLMKSAKGYGSFVP